MRHWEDVDNQLPVAVILYDDVGGKGLRDPGAQIFHSRTVEVHKDRYLEESLSTDSSNRGGKELKSELLPTMVRRL